MNVRTAATSEPIVEDNGSTPVWYFVSPGSLREATAGGLLELDNEFEARKDGAGASRGRRSHEL